MQQEINSCHQETPASGKMRRVALPAKPAWHPTLRAIGWIALSALLLPQLGCQRQSGGPERGPAEVAVITVQPESVLITTELPGRTIPFLVADIRPQVNGIIQQRLFEEGAIVEAGQVLYQIDPAPFEAALNSAQASLAAAEANVGSLELRVDRYKPLIEDKAISQQYYDDAFAALKQAQAQVDVWKAAVATARINLGYTSVKAPISGRIGRSAVTEGALVTAFQPLALATIQQLDPIYVDVPQAATELLEWQRRLGQGRLQQANSERSKVRLTLADGSPYALTGTLQFHDVSVDPSTGSVTLRTVFPNPDGVLLPGMFVRVDIAEGVDEDALLVPQQCVRRTPKGEPYVLLVDGEDTVQQRVLTVDRALGNRWLVSSGLESGDRIVVEGLQKARPGTTVKAVPFVMAHDGGTTAEGEPATSTTGE